MLRNLVLFAVLSAVFAGPFIAIAASGGMSRDEFRRAHTSCTYSAATPQCGRMAAHRL